MANRGKKLGLLIEKLNSFEKCQYVDFGKSAFHKIIII